MSRVRLPRGAGTLEDAELVAVHDVFRDMQDDAARQLLFRLQVVKLDVKS